MAKLVGASQVARGQEGSGAAFILPGSNQTPFDVIQQETAGIRYRQKIEEDRRLKAEKDQYDRMIAGLKDNTIDLKGIWDRDAAELGDAVTGIREMQTDFYVQGKHPDDPRTEEYGIVKNAYNAALTGVEASKQHSEMYLKSYNQLRDHPEKYEVIESAENLKEFGKLKVKDRIGWDKPILVEKPPDYQKIAAEVLSDYKPDEIESKPSIGGEYIQSTTETGYSEADQQAIQNVLYDRFIREQGEDAFRKQFESSIISENERNSILEEAERTGKSELKIFSDQVYAKPFFIKKLEYNIQNANNVAEERKASEAGASFFLDAVAEVATNPDVWEQRPTYNQYGNKVEYVDKTGLYKGYIWGKEGGKDKFGKPFEETIRIKETVKDENGQVWVVLSNGKREPVDLSDPNFIGHVMSFNTSTTFPKLLDAQKSIMKNKGAVTGKNKYDWNTYKGKAIPDQFNPTNTPPTEDQFD